MRRSSLTVEGSSLTDEENVVTQTSDLLTIDQVAQRLGLPKQTLAQWRYLGRGPAFIKLGPKSVRYAASDVDTWLDSQRTTPSTNRPSLAATS